MDKRDLFNLNGKVVLVTGATGGLGSEIAVTMAEFGARVIASDIQGEKAPQHPNITFIACDLSRSEDIEQLIYKAKSLYGCVDVLVSNAGIQGPAGSLGDISDNDWQQVMDINLKSAVTLCSSLIPDMVENGGGSIILMSSIAGLRGNKAIGLYGLSKAALAQLARNLAVEWGPSGIRVNSISPGLIRTPLATELINNESFIERRLSLTPLRRVGEPKEIAGVAVMLASSVGGFITGQNIVVDGGTVISDGN